MTKKNEFTELFEKAFDKEALKKIVFSRPLGEGAVKVSGRLCAHRAQKILSLEYSAHTGAVSQKNLSRSDAASEIEALLSHYAQVNMITALGDVEYKLSKKGNAVLLGADKLRRRISGEAPAFEAAIEALDKKKNYILSGTEQFLIRLGVSDKSGRVHDKKQGKFRQINRFLEHIEDIYTELPTEGKILIYDLCSGKSYLSFAVYHFLTVLKQREVEMLCIDLKDDVIDWCRALASELSYTGMRFVCDDVRKTPKDIAPDMVISLHACDVATDIVLDTAIELSAKVILSTPCCHRYLNDKINAPELKFVTDYPHIRNKLCEAITDAIRIARLRDNGYTVSALELTDPENTPKNTLIRAILKDKRTRRDGTEYENILRFVLGEGYSQYLKEIR